MAVFSERARWRASERLFYQDANGNGAIAQSEIREENNYYPFGLTHKGYNYYQNMRDHKYGFNNQESLDDLGLNFIEYKFRIYDPEIGRFIQIDPLSEDYPYNGSFNFAENRVIEAIELEGLEAYFIHGTWGNPTDMSSSQLNSIKNIYGNKSSERLKWTGDNSDKARLAAAESIARKIAEDRMSSSNASEESITLIGHSHGGNVAIEAINILRSKYEINDPINLITLNTPVLDDHQLNSYWNIDHFNIIAEGDVIKKLGGMGSDLDFLKDWEPLAGREFDEAENFYYEDGFSLLNRSGCGLSKHCGTASQNFWKWLDYLNIEQRKKRNRKMKLSRLWAQVSIGIEKEKKRRQKQRGENGDDQ
ncbi:RHS repeat-associated core domain-containing protein [Flavobacteriaceae bacterium M23B6Z8]